MTEAEEDVSEFSFHVSTRTHRCPVYYSHVPCTIFVTTGLALHVVPIAALFGNFSPSSRRRFRGGVLPRFRRTRAVLFATLNGQKSNALAWECKLSSLHLASGRGVDDVDNLR